MSEAIVNSANLSSILVVDDEESTRLGLCLLLQGEGYSVRTAAHGLEALLALRAVPSDLVLTDFHMPQMNGLEFLKVLRRDFPRVHVIMMSAQSGLESILNTQNSGVFECLTKPVNLDSLRQVIERLKISHITVLDQ